MLAVVALVATMSPITAAHAAGNVDVHIINNEGQILDVWMSGQRVVTGLAINGHIDITITAGSKQVVACRSGSGGTVTNTNCNSVVLPVTPMQQGQYDFVGGHSNTLVFGPNATLTDPTNTNTFGFTNDLTPTANGNYRVSLNNAGIPGGLNLCVNGVQVITNSLPATPGTTLAPGAENEAASSVPQMVQVASAAGLPNCGTPLFQTLLNLAAGTNTVINFVGTAASDVQVLSTDQQDVANTPVDAAFCKALLSLQGIEAQITALFAPVKAGDPATTPSKFQVKTLVDTINAAIALGDAHVPNLQKGYWGIAVQGLEDLAGQLTAFGFDLGLLKTEDQQALINFATHVAQPPNPERDTAVEGLTAYAVANCLSASTVKGSGPKFTG
jgi:hypothetical protein